ncbi:MAG TPA: hypothetical protein VIK33_00670 [Anaerolineae bacterium]
MEATEKQDRFKTLVAGLLALVTILGAVVAWRAAAANDIASNADFAGIAATLNAEESRALNAVTAYEHLRAYTDYVRYNELGNAIADSLADAPETDRVTLERQMRDAWDLATEIEGTFFENRYVKTDGTYDIPRQLDELWSDDAQNKDLNPDLHFAQSDAARAKSTTLIGILIVLGLLLVLYTLANTLASRVRYLMAAGATIFLVGSVIALIVIETTM